MIEQILLEINSIEDLWDRRLKCVEFHRRSNELKDQKILARLYDKITDDIVDFESERTFLNCLEEGFESFEEEYCNERSSTDFYVDQAPTNSRYFDRTFFKAYTSYGIKNLSSWIVKQIIHKSKYDKETLEKMIKCNYHFHNIIKTDLIHNLRNYTQQENL